MQKFHRGTRRHHRERLFAKRFQQFYPRKSMGTVRENGPMGWVHQKVVRTIDTPTHGCCSYCYNPRQIHGNGMAALPFRDWKHALAQSADASAE